MDTVKAVYEHRWTGPIAFVAGLVAFAVGVTLDGISDADIRSAGIFIALLAYGRLRDVAWLKRSRSTHRFLRCFMRTERVAANPRGGDEG
jgi:uncharacterized membrane protein YiaA